MASLDKWVPKLFGDNARKSGKDTWRISSAKLGREMQEDLSIDRKGVKDFGLHDQEDARDGKRTPVDLLLHEDYQCVIAEDYQSIANPKEAALRLCDLIGRPDLKELFSQFKPFRLLGADDASATLATPEWPAGTLPAELEDHVTLIAERLRAAPGASAFAHFTTMMACIPAGVRVDVLRDGTFLERPNVYALIVARSGSAKSSVMGAAQEPLAEYEREWQAERKRMQTEEARKAKTAKRRAAVPATNDATSNPAFQVSEEPTDNAPATFGSEAAQKGLDRRRSSTDATTERLVRLSAQYPDGIILNADEFGVIMGNMDRYSAGRGGGISKDQSMLIAGHNGGRYVVDRVTSDTIETDAFVLSILSSTQPSMIGGYVNDPSVGIGLFQRFLYCPMGDVAELRSEAPLDELTQARYRLAVRLLLDLVKDHGTRTLKFSHDAVAVWREADQWSVLERRTAKSETERGLVSKTGTHVARAALGRELICWAWAAAGDEGPQEPPAEVSGASARAAFDLWKRFLLPAARQCLSIGSAARVDADAKAMADMLEKMGDGERTKLLTRNSAAKGSRKFKSEVSFIKAAEALTEIGWLAPTKTYKGTAGWVINPEVWAA